MVAQNKFVRNPVRLVNDFLYSTKKNLLLYKFFHHQIHIRLMPAENIHNFLGVHTPLTTTFNSIFVTDFWQYLNEWYIFALVQEAKRLGQTVYMLLEITIDNRTRLSIDKSAVYDLEQCLAALELSHTIQKFSSFNVGLTVIIIK